MSSYIVFFTEQSILVRRQHPTVIQTEMAKLCGEQWRGLSNGQKELYKAVAKRARETPISGVNIKSYEGI